MFRRSLIGWGSLWLILALTCFWIFQNISTDAHLAYRHLMNLSEQEKNEEIKGQKSLTQQTRDQVSKQIFYKKNLDRLQSRLTSEHSELIFDLKGEGGELIEHFQGVICTMQEKLMEPSMSEEKSSDNLLSSKQYVRALQAGKAIYSYKSGQLEADDVKIAHYLIPGTLLPSSLDLFPPLLQGHAEKLQLSFFKELHLNAQGFQAVFYDWGNE